MYSRYIYKIPIFVLFLSLIPFELTLSNYPETFKVDGIYFNITNIREDIVFFTSSGPKMYGFSNHRKATYILHHQLMKIAESSKNDYYEIKVKLIFQTNFLKRNFEIPSFIYGNRIPSIFVEIIPKHNRYLPYCLINCHYDSVPGSPGASDNYLNCALMTEFIKAFSNSNKLYPFTCIPLFIYNGAEENSIMATAFLVKFKKIMKKVSSFINLDACGAGGRDFMFRATENGGDLVSLYAETVPFPLTTVLSQDIYNLGIIPSYTDFKNYKEIENVKGVDIAFIGNGFLYHTPKDSVDEIKDDTIYMAANNLFSFSLALFSHPTDRKPPIDLLYFDLWGFCVFKINWPYYKYFSLIIAIFLISVFSFQQTENYIFMGIQLLSLSISAAFSIGISYLMTLFSKSLVWLSKSYLLGIIYGYPFLVVYSSLLFRLVRLLNHFRKNDSKKYGPINFVGSTVIISSISTVVLACFDLKSVYLITLMSITFLILIFVKFLVFNIGKYDFEDRIILAVYSLAFIPYTLYVRYMFYYVYKTFIPIAGRRYFDNTDVIFCIFVLIDFTLTFLPYTTLIYSLFEESIWINNLFSFVYLIIAFLVLQNYICPYNEKSSPKRLLIIHYEEIFYDLNLDLKSLPITTNGYALLHSFDARYFQDIVLPIDNVTAKSNTIIPPGIFKPVKKEYSDSFRSHSRIFETLEKPKFRNHPQFSVNKSCFEDICEVLLKFDACYELNIDIQITEANVTLLYPEKFVILHKLTFSIDKQEFLRIVYHQFDCIYNQTLILTFNTNFSKKIGYIHAFYFFYDDSESQFISAFSGSLPSYVLPVSYKGQRVLYFHLCEANMFAINII